jgi:predicted P-loop ATPase
MLTKEKILEKVDEESLIRHLVPTFVGNLRKKNYKSILSDKDDKPSMSFYKDGGKWKFKSHNTGHQGDVFTLWGEYYGINCQTHFKELLERIDKEMLLGLDEPKFVQPSAHTHTVKVKESCTNDSSLSKNFSISYQPYTKLFLSYWAQFGVTEDTLIHFNVKQVSKISFISNSGRPLAFNYQLQGKLVSCYDIDGKVKLYIPGIPSGFSSDLFFKEQKKAFGFKNQTKSDIFGLSELPEGALPYIIFTAGEKDCMSAHARGLLSISMQSENQLPEESLLQILRAKTKVLLSCYDTDKAGMRASKLMEDAFGIAPIHLPDDVKDLSEYFQRYTIDDFNPLLEENITKSKHLQPACISYKKQSSKQGETLFHKVEHYLNEKFEFRFDTIALQIEIRTKKSTSQWDKVNDAELCSNINKHGIKVSLQTVQLILKSFFVVHYNPIKSYFLQFDDLVLPHQNYIKELASYVLLENSSPEAFDYWYTHLKKWMIRSIRTVFETYAINKHALILSSDHEGIGKSYFCEFLCPPSLRPYYNSNPTVDNDKDAQVSLATNFIINLDELQQFKSGASKLKSWLSQTSIKVRLPYEKTDTIKHRIASFLGTTNELEFLRSGIGYSRWIGFRIVGTKRIDKFARDLLEKSWSEAYHCYKSDTESGELTREELDALQERSSEFLSKSIESEIIEKYLTSATKEEGEFMTTTDILQYLQERIGISIKLNKIMIGKALSELGFEREKFGKSSKEQRYGYLVIRKF